MSDNGIGIQPERALEAFRPFRRLHGGREGFGIGLSSCKKIVEMHGGRIWIEAGARGGTTVRFTLPSSAAEQRAA